MNSTIYLYTSSARPSQPLCIIPGFTYCPRYSFHMFDIFTINDDWSDWKFTPYEMELSSLIAERFTQFVYDGVVNAWLPFNYEEEYPEVYVTVDLNMPEALRRNERVKECYFWKENGFSQFYWQN